MNGEAVVDVCSTWSWVMQPCLTCITYLRLVWHGLTATLCLSVSERLLSAAAATAVLLQA